MPLPSVAVQRLVALIALGVGLPSCAVSAAGTPPAAEVFRCSGLLIHNPSTEAIQPCRFEGTPLPSAEQR